MHNKGANKHTFTIAVMLFASAILLSLILTAESAFAQPDIPITVIDAVTNTNVKVLGEAPAMPMGSIYQQQIVRTQVPDKELVKLKVLDAEISGDLLRLDAESFAREVGEHPHLAVGLRNGQVVFE